MIKYTNQLLGRLPYELLVAIFFMLVMTSVSPGNPVTGIVAALLMAVCALVAVMRQWISDHEDVSLLAKDRVNELQVQIIEFLRQAKAVDIWSFQEDLMKASDQEIPPGPRINKNVLLYLALMAEELGETAAAVRKELELYLIVSDMEFEALSEEEQHQLVALRQVHDQLNAIVRLQDLADSIRGHLTYVSDGWWLRPTRQGAEDMLDGVTDVAVVTAGLGLAAGLPAREGYHEVGASNLSKANPVTGKIDKDPSGKWIKGSQYKAPDLGTVLERHMQEAQP